MKAPTTTQLTLLILLSLVSISRGFLVIERPGAIACRVSNAPLFSINSKEYQGSAASSRRHNIKQLAAVLSGSLLGICAGGSPATAEDYETRNSQRQYIQESYEDFTKTSEGLLYRQVKPGNGVSAKEGDRVVFQFSGYTIGYFGRPFQAKGGPQGGAFDKDLDYERTVIGSGTMIKGLELALKDMQPNEVRQVVIPMGPLSYPEDDPTHERVGPKPATFSGQRALNFVLDNPRLDRTLLFNVKVIRVDKADGKGGFVRG